MNAILLLRVCGLVEGGSLLILVFIAVPLKYLAGMPTATRVTGSLHGLLFLMFVVTLFRASLEQKWGLAKTLAFLTASVVPFGVIFLDRRLRQEMPVAD